MGRVGVKEARLIGRIDGIVRKAEKWKSSKVAKQKSRKAEKQKRKERLGIWKLGSHRRCR